MGWLKDIFAEFLDILDDGVKKPARLTINFGQGIKATDNEAAQRLDVEVPTTSSSEAGLLPATTGANKVLVANGSNVPTWTLTPGPLTSVTCTGGSAAAPSYLFSASATSGLFSPSADIVALSLGGAEQWRFAASTWTWAKSIAAPTWTQTAKDADETPQNIIVKTQAPWASATTAAKKTPGSFVVNVPLPISGGNEAAIQLQRNDVALCDLKYVAVHPITGQSGPGIVSAGHLLIQSASGSRIVIDCGTSQPLDFRGGNWQFWDAGGALGITVTNSSTTPGITFGASATPTITSTVSASGAGRAMTIEAQTGAANTAGGELRLKGGAGAGTGAYGDVVFTGRQRLQQTTKAMADADQTLTTAEAGASVIILTGANAADRTLTMGPAAAGLPFDVDNRCTGAFGVTIKCATGTGIKINNGRGARLYCDGTNVYRLSADSITTV